MSSAAENIELHLPSASQHAHKGVAAVQHCVQQMAVDKSYQNGFLLLWQQFHPDFGMCIYMHLQGLSCPFCWLHTQRQYKGHSQSAGIHKIHADTRHNHQLDNCLPSYALALPGCVALASPAGIVDDMFLCRVRVQTPSAAWPRTLQQA